MQSVGCTHHCLVNTVRYLVSRHTHCLVNTVPSALCSETAKCTAKYINKMRQVQLPKGISLLIRVGLRGSVPKGISLLEPSIPSICSPGPSLCVPVEILFRFLDYSDDSKAPGGVERPVVTAQSLSHSGPTAVITRSPYGSRSVTLQ